MQHETRSLNPTTLSTMKGLFNVVRAFSEFPETYISTVLAVASNEGKSVRDYARICGCSNATMSKRLLDLGDALSADKTRDGAGLVEVRPDLMDRRFMVVRLSATGRALAERMARMMVGRSELVEN